MLMINETLCSRKGSNPRALAIQADNTYSRAIVELNDANNHWELDPRNCISDKNSKETPIQGKGLIIKQTQPK